MFVVASAGFSMLLLLGKVGGTVPQLFLMTAILNAAVAVYIFTLVPEFLMRFIVWIWVHRFYRLTKTGLEHIPERGPALLVCNHASFVDALIIFAGSPRPVPVIPLALRGLWGSFFSRRAGTAMRFPRGILSRIELVGAPATAAALATPEHLQAVVAELRGEWR